MGPGEVAWDVDRDNLPHGEQLRPCRSRCRGRSSPPTPGTLGGEGLASRAAGIVHRVMGCPFPVGGVGVKPPPIIRKEAL
jgi:hypothetical protein